MRLGLFIATAFAVLASGAVTTAQLPVPPDGILGSGRVPVPVPGAVVPGLGEKEALVLESGLIHPGWPLAESTKGVFGIALVAEVVKGRFGRGTLVLEPNVPIFDDFGFRTTDSTRPFIRLECTLNLVKRRRIRRRSGQGVEVVSHEEEWLLYKVQGPKITSRLFLAKRTTSPAVSDPAYRLLVHDKEGKVQYAVDISTPPIQHSHVSVPLIEPCHPGCFPASTAIELPGGAKPIEQVREGDLVTTVGPDGVGALGRVASVFVSRNRLLEVRTDAGSVLTTGTQPFSLAAGGLRAAGELKPGDRIWRWDGGRRRAVAVQSVSATGREQPVYNLILADPAIFVAEGFLVRSKPPAPVAPGPTQDVVP